MNCKYHSVLRRNNTEKPPPDGPGAVETVKKRCHSEPVRTLAWESVLFNRKVRGFLQKTWNTDCHTSDIGHWFAMTTKNRTFLTRCPSPKGKVIGLHASKASPWGLRPQTRFGGQPPEAALRPEMKLSAKQTDEGRSAETKTGAETIRRRSTKLQRREIFILPAPKAPSGPSE